MASARTVPRRTIVIKTWIIYILSVFYRQYTRYTSLLVTISSCCISFLVEYGDLQNGGFVPILESIQIDYLELKNFSSVKVSLCFSKSNQLEMKLLSKVSSSNKMATECEDLSFSHGDQVFFFQDIFLSQKLTVLYFWFFFVSKNK